MQNLFYRFELSPFQEHQGVEVIRWALSLEEARRWGGPSLSWPLDPCLFSRWHSDPDVQPYVLCYGEELLGYGELWVDPEAQEVELARIVLNPAERGRGVGRQFVRLLLEQAKPCGYPSAYVRVFPENGRAIACYRSVGFTPVSASEQQTYNQGQPIAYLWMQWDFGAPVGPEHSS